MSGHFYPVCAACGEEASQGIECPICEQSVLVCIECKDAVDIDPAMYCGCEGGQPVEPPDDFPWADNNFKDPREPDDEF